MYLLDELPKCRIRSVISNSARQMLTAPQSQYIYYVEQKQSLHRVRVRIITCPQMRCKAEHLYVTG